MRALVPSALALMVLAGLPACELITDVQKLPKPAGDGGAVPTADGSVGLDAGSSADAAEGEDAGPGSDDAGAAGLDAAVGKPDGSATAVEDCDNGMDEDEDGHIDCADADCQADPACSCKPKTCLELGFNCDTASDGCSGTLFCGTCTAPQTCNGGGVANVCGAVEADCANQIDDDGDGQTDCLDPNCYPDPDCASEKLCGNGVDEDRDGATDCDDDDCALACNGETDCGDGVDDDGDGSTDCADPKCGGKGCGVGCTCNASTLRKVEIACADFMDNDGDTFMDCNDLDCVGGACGIGCVCLDGARKEATCNDGSDNDGDTSTDCTDSDCTANYACAPSLFISEYVEGTGTNQAIELYNASGVTLDLSPCSLRFYSNGSPTPTTTYNGPAGVFLPTKATYVMCNSPVGSALSSKCELYDSNITFNGDDAVALVCDGVTMDVIGQIGFDPGDAWSAAAVSTMDSTLRRKCTVSAGDKTGGDTFDPAVEWDSYPADTVDGLHLSCP